MAIEILNHYGWQKVNSYFEDTFNCPEGTNYLLVMSVIHGVGTYRNHDEWNGQNNVFANLTVSLSSGSNPSAQIYGLPNPLTGAGTLGFKWDSNITGILTAFALSGVDLLTARADLGIVDRDTKVNIASTNDSRSYAEIFPNSVLFSILGVLNNPTISCGGDQTLLENRVTGTASLHALATKCNGVNPLVASYSWDGSAIVFSHGTVVMAAGGERNQAIFLI